MFKKWSLERSNETNLVSVTVESLMYIQVYTTPDITQNILVLLDGTIQVHGWILEDAKKVVGYLLWIKYFMLVYSSRDRKFSKRIFWFTGSQDGMDLHMTMCLSWLVGRFREKVLKHTITAQSTTHAEFIACYKVIIQEVWLKNFAYEFSIVDSISKLIKTYCENVSTVCYSKNK